IDLDVATAADIERLPRLGPTLARRIVANRDSLGPFGDLEGLKRVRRIGPAPARIRAPPVWIDRTGEGPSESHAAAAPACQILLKLTDERSRIRLGTRFRRPL